MPPVSYTPNPTKPKFTWVFPVSASTYSGNSPKNRWASWAHKPLLLSSDWTAPRCIQLPADCAWSSTGAARWPYSTLLAHQAVQHDAHPSKAQATYKVFCLSLLIEEERSVRFSVLSAAQATNRWLSTLTARKCAPLLMMSGWGAWCLGLPTPHRCLHSWRVAAPMVWCADLFIFLTVFAVNFWSRLL